MRNLIVALAGGVLFSASILLTASPGIAEEGSGLIGKWSGQWSHTQYGTGDYYLVVKDLKGDTFSGVIYIATTSPRTPYGHRELPIQGTISGTAGSETLHYTYSTFLTTELQRNGNEMQGKGCATVCSDLFLKKEK